jgi:hypothetical protein
MPSLELAAGQVLTAAHTNTYWMRQVVATGLSSARPTGYEGRVIYDTDTDALMVYASATTGWRPPWNMPWGFIARSVNASSVSLNNAQGIVAPSITIPVLKNRRIRITGIARAITDPADPGVLHYSCAVSAGNSNLANTGAIGEALMGMDTGGGEWNVISFHTYFDIVNTGTITLNGLGWAASCVATYAAGCWIVVEDVGPAAGPA